MHHSFLHETLPRCPNFILTVGAVDKTFTYALYTVPYIVIIGPGEDMKAS